MPPAVGIIEILVHWHAGRNRNSTKIAASLNVDRKTVRRYAVAAQAAGMVPDVAPLSEAQRDSKVREWFSELRMARLESRPT